MDCILLLRRETTPESHQSPLQPSPQPQDKPKKKQKEATVLKSAPRVELPEELPDKHIDSSTKVFGWNDLVQIFMEHISYNLFFF